MDQGTHFIEAGDPQGHVGALLVVAHLAATSLPALDTQSAPVVGIVVLSEGDAGEQLHVVHGPVDLPQVPLFELVLQGKDNLWSRPQGWFL